MPKMAPVQHTTNFVFFAMKTERSCDSTVHLMIVIASWGCVYLTMNTLPFVDQNAFTFRYEMVDHETSLPNVGLIYFA